MERRRDYFLVGLFHSEFNNYSVEMVCILYAYNLISSALNLFLVITLPVSPLQITVCHLIAFFPLCFLFSSLPSHRNIRYEDFFSALRQYASCEQREGK